MIDEAGVEVHVGVELALDKVFVLEGDALAFEGDFEERVLAHQVEDLVGHAFDDAGTRIIVLVNAMAEAHQLGFAGFDALDEIGNFLHRADFHQHAQDFFVGASVKRPVERSDSRCSGGIGIHMRAADAANGVGGAILFVIGMQDKEHVERVLESRIRLVARFRGAEKHVQEVAGITQIVIGIDKGHAERMAIRKRGYRRHFPDQAVGLLLARLGVKNILGVMIERRKRGNGRNHHAHGMGVIVKAVEKFLDALVDESVMRDVIGPVLKLGSGGQFAVEQEIRRFEVRAFFREIFDGIAAVTENALIAVDESDAANARGGVVECRVVAHHAKFRGIDFDLAKIGGANGAVRDRHLIAFARAVVRDRESFAGLERALGFSGVCCGRCGIH